MQKYYCKQCCKFQRATYSYLLSNRTTDSKIVQFHNEGLSISSVSRLLKIPKTTVSRRILKQAGNVQPPAITETNQVYEVDEMQTFIKKRDKTCWVYITYAINRKTRNVIDFVVGRRSREVIGKIIEKLLLLKPSKIFTDGLNIYPSLIPSTMHHCFQYRTNIIERNNLTIRNSLKRLSRKTICFSKSVTMLEACLKLYFWG